MLRTGIWLKKILYRRIQEHTYIHKHTLKFKQCTGLMTSSGSQKGVRCPHTQCLVMFSYHCCSFCCSCQCLGLPTRAGWTPLLPTDSLELYVVWPTLQLLYVSGTLTLCLRFICKSNLEEKYLEKMDFSWSLWFPIIKAQQVFQKQYFPSNLTISWLETF